MNVEHFNRKLAPDQFDPDSAGPVHLTKGNGRTICGVKHDAPADGLVSDNGWAITFGLVTCKKCLRRLRNASLNRR
jgi:hypothetical protein